MNWVDLMRWRIKLKELSFGRFRPKLLLLIELNTVFRRKSGWFTVGSGRGHPQCIRFHQPPENITGKTGAVAPDVWCMFGPAYSQIFIVYLSGTRYIRFSCSVLSLSLSRRRCWFLHKNKNREDKNLRAGHTNFGELTTTAGIAPNLFKKAISWSVRRHICPKTCIYYALLSPCFDVELNFVLSCQPK